MHQIKLPLNEFNRSLLPSGDQATDGTEFRKAVQHFFEVNLLDSTGAAEVIVSEQEITLKWTNESRLNELTASGVDLLSNGDYERGISILKFALKRNANDTIALYNIGMALSDKGMLIESESLLNRLISLEPSDARARIALGVALARQNKIKEAIDSLQIAVNLDPQDPFALKNLGALMISDSNHWEDAELYLKRATQIQEDDAQVWINLGKLYEKSERLDEADDAYIKVLNINPYDSLGQMAEQGRSRIAEHNFRAKGDLRPDALMYCLGAIQKFEGMPFEDVRKITFEIATLGMSGLDINDPTQKYSIQSLPGKYSGLNLLCIEYVGFKQIDPIVDLGFDLSREYEEALKMAN